jgi:hypothetical protein
LAVLRAGASRGQFATFEAVNESTLESGPRFEVSYIRNRLVLQPPSSRTHPKRISPRPGCVLPSLRRTIAAKSGMTGAVSEGFHAYGVGHHRQMAELDQEFSAAAGRDVIVSFTPHLVLMNRGILSYRYTFGGGGVASAFQ